MRVSNGLIVIAGSVFFGRIASRLKPINEKLAECGFFIYAFHGFPILFMSRLIVSILHPNNTIMWLGCYIGCFVTIVLLE